MPEVLEPGYKNCECCGKPFYYIGRGPVKYCDECRNSKTVQAYRKRKYRHNKSGRDAEGYLTQKCILCDAEFKAKHSNARYCPKCKEELRLKKMRNAPKLRVEPALSINEVVNLACKEGLSYGLYVSRRGV